MRARRSRDRVPAAHRGDGARRVGARASLLYREIAAAATPRDRGALHLELALIFEERLDDDAQAQVNFEQALAFDPTIPAAKLPLARRYEAIGRYADAARLYEEAADDARAADRARAARGRGALPRPPRARPRRPPISRPSSIAPRPRGDLDAALELAHQLWRAEPGHPAAFRVLANVHRTLGDLAALTELTTVRAQPRRDTPTSARRAWLEVARLAEELGKLDQAARAYDLALIEDPGARRRARRARRARVPARRLGDRRSHLSRPRAPATSVLGDDELALRRSIIAEQLGRDSRGARARAARPPRPRPAAATS